jgi:transcription attenuation protein (tryptophan RNA-binding attenuator protein)
MAENEMAQGMEEPQGDYVAIKALENGVTVIGVTRGLENKFLHTEKLDEGEVWLAQFTKHISAMKIRGRARIYTKLGEITSGKHQD